MAKVSVAYGLRVVACLSFLIAAIVLFLTHQDVHVTQSSIILITSLDWPGLWYCLIIYFIGCAYNLFVLLLPDGSPLWKTVIVLDVIMNIAVGASLGVGWEIEALTRGGYMAGRWYPLCGVVNVFCARLLGSLVMATIGFGCSFSLLMYTIYVLADPFLVGK